MEYVIRLRYTVPMSDTITAQLQHIEQRLDTIEHLLRPSEPDTLFARASAASRARVIAAGLTDLQLDALIDEARTDVAPAHA